MRILIHSFTLSLGFVASIAQAQETVIVDGAEYKLSALMENCQKITGAPEAQLACFNSLSQLIEKQNSQPQDGGRSVRESLSALRSLAQYQDADSGLSILGTDCRIQILYFNNYYYLSRRNVSSIDLFSAQFDASKLQYDQTSEVRGAQAPLFKGVMENGSSATTHGGIALESKDHNFEPKSARAAMNTYAIEVVDQLPGRQEQTFDFVLVHPNKNGASGNIWTAFEEYVNACKS